MTYGESSNFENCVLLNTTGKGNFVLIVLFTKGKTVVGVQQFLNSLRNSARQVSPRRLSLRVLRSPPTLSSFLSSILICF